MKGIIDATVYSYLLDYSVLPTLWQQFGEYFFLVWHDKVRSVQKWFVKISVELKRPAQNPDLNHIEHISDELERRLRARPNCPTLFPDLTSTRVAEWKQMFKHLVESFPRRVATVIAVKRGPTPY